MLATLSEDQVIRIIQDDELAIETLSLEQLQALEPSEPSHKQQIQIILPNGICVRAHVNSLFRTLSRLLEVRP